MKLLLFFTTSIFSADVCKNAAVSTCKFVIDEICGSNGKTYLNECVFQKAACFAEDDLTGTLFDRVIFLILSGVQGRLLSERMRD